MNRLAFVAKEFERPPQDGERRDGDRDRDRTRSRSTSTPVDSATEELGQAGGGGRFRRDAHGRILPRSKPPPQTGRSGRPAAAPPLQRASTGSFHSPGWPPIRTASSTRSPPTRTTGTPGLPACTAPSRSRSCRHRPRPASGPRRRTGRCRSRSRRSGRRPSRPGSGSRSSRDRR